MGEMDTANGPGHLRFRIPSALNISVALTATKSVRYTVGNGKGEETLFAFLLFSRLASPPDPANFSHQEQVLEKA